MVNPIPNTTTLPDLPECDDDFDGFTLFTLTERNNDALAGQMGLTVSYHSTESEADSGTLQLGPIYTNTIANNEQIWVRLTNPAGGCHSTMPLNLVVKPLPAANIQDNYVICTDSSSIGLDYVEVDPELPPSNYTFIWRDLSGNLLSGDAVYTIEQSGIYSVEISSNDASLCSTGPLIFTVNESEAPILTAIVNSEEFADNHVITATAIGTGVYEFSLDQGPWQDSGIFFGVRPGQRTVYARDVNDCGEDSIDIQIIDYPAFFTPNSDGYNDTWNIGVLSSQMASKIYIFDRFGKLIKQLSPSGEGWDGTYNGQKMPTTDFWFLLEFNDFNTGAAKQLRGHFTLKR